MPTDCYGIHVYKFSCILSVFCHMLEGFSTASRFSTLRLHSKIFQSALKLYLTLNSADCHGTVLKSIGRDTTIKYAYEYTVYMSFTRYFCT